MSWQAALLRPLLRLQRAYQANATIEGVRKSSRYAETMVMVPRGVHHEFFEHGGLHYEWITPSDPIPGAAILYLHGGGFCLPNYHVQRNVMGWVSKLAKVRVLFVDYRLAPEHPFPAGLDDCITAYRYLPDVEKIDPARIVLAGESAGGSLVITALLRIRDDGLPLPAGGVPMSAPFDLEGSQEFFSGRDVMAHPNFVIKHFRAYVGSSDPHNPLISPIYADLRGLPPLLMQVGEREGFRGEMQTVADNAKKAGVDAALTIYPGMWHYWHIFVNILPEARAAVEEIAAWVRGRVLAMEGN
jgi:acetyl esterase/lipase